MVRVAFKHRFQRRHDLAAAALGLRAARLPVVPRLRVHHRLGVQRLDRVVGRIARGDLLHRVRICSVECGALGLRIGRIALGERVDQRAVARRRGRRQRDRLAERGQRGRIGFRHHRHVDVRPENQRFAPEAHGAGGVELLRLAEGALRLGVVERERQADSLIEPGLRLGAARASLEPQRAEIGVEHRRVRQYRFGGHRLERRRLGSREDQFSQQRRWSACSRSAGGTVAQQRIEADVVARICRGWYHEAAGGGERKCDAMAF